MRDGGCHKLGEHRKRSKWSWDFWWFLASAQGIALLLAKIRKETQEHMGAELRRGAESESDLEGVKLQVLYIPVEIVGSGNWLL